MKLFYICIKNIFYFMYYIYYLFINILKKNLYKKIILYKYKYI